MSLFGPPNVEKLKAKRDVAGLIKALGYQRDKDFANDFQASSEARRIRDEAAVALGVLGDKRAVEPLIVTLGYPNKYVGKSAAEALGLLGDRRAVAALIASLKRQDKDVRPTTLAALSRLPVSPDNDAAGAAYWVALGEWDKCVGIGGPAIEPLIAIIGDEENGKSAANALGRMGASAVGPLIAILRDATSWSSEQRNIITALVSIGAPAVEPLLAAMSDRGSENCEQAARVLGRIGGSGALEALLDALGEGGSGLGRAAAYALGELGDVRAVAPLIGVLKDKRQDQPLRSDAAVALGKLGDVRAVALLIGVLGDKAESDLRKIAATALGLLGDQQAVAPLLTAFYDQDGAIRSAAAAALDKLAWSPDAGVEGAAYWAARGRWFECIEMGAPAIEPLIAALRDESRYVRKTVAEGLVAIYQSGSLGPEERARLLAQRGIITASHQDEKVGCWITVHEDEGIGVEFPV